MPKKKQDTSWMHDGDDFRVDAPKKHSKKKISSSSKGHPAVKVTKKKASVKKLSVKK